MYKVDNIIELPNLYPYKCSNTKMNTFLSTVARVTALQVKLVFLFPFLLMGA